MELEKVFLWKVAICELGFEQLNLILSFVCFLIPFVCVWLEKY